MEAEMRKNNKKCEHDKWKKGARVATKMRE